MGSRKATKAKTFAALLNLPLFLRLSLSRGLSVPNTGGITFLLLRALGGQSVPVSKGSGEDGHPEVIQAFDLDMVQPHSRGRFVSRNCIMKDLTSRASSREPAVSPR